MSDTLREINRLATRRAEIWRAYSYEKTSAKTRVSQVQQITIELAAAWDRRRREMADELSAIAESMINGVSVVSTLDQTIRVRALRQGGRMDE